MHLQKNKVYIEIYNTQNKIKSNKMQMEHFHIQQLKNLNVANHRALASAIARKKNRRVKETQTGDRENERQRKFIDINSY